MNLPDSHPMAKLHGELGQQPVSTEALTSEAYFEVEREAVFKQSWFMVGRESEIPQPGDYFVKRLETLNTTVVVTRDANGQVHALHDLCPHRGMHVCGKPQTGHRKGKSFTCQFHGWVFGMDGVALDIPDQDLFYGVEKSTMRMPPFAIDTWEGFIFVHWDEHPKESLQEFLGELYDGYNGYFDDAFFSPAGAYHADMKMNYKFYLDSSVEALHANYTHIQNNTGQNADSGIALFLGPDAIKLTGRHRIISAPLGVGQRELSPMEALGFKFGGPTTPYDPRVRERPVPPLLNPGKSEDWAFDVVEIFPSTLLFLSAAFYAVIQMWPRAVNHTQFDTYVYMHKPANAAERVAVEYGLVSLREVMREDLNMAEGCTDALASGKLNEIQLSDQEVAVRHSYAMINQAIEEYLSTN